MPITTIANMDQEKEIGRRLTAAMREHGITPADMARRLDVSRNAVAKWMRTGQIARDKIVGISRELERSTDYLLTGYERSNIEMGGRLTRRCPLISLEQARKWSDLMYNFGEKDAEAHLYCPVECSPQTFVLRVKGTSMSPRFPDGDLIYVDPMVPPESERYVVALFENTWAVVFRQIIIDGGNTYLKATNPEWPDPIKEVTEPVKIIGTIVFHGESV